MQEQTGRQTKRQTPKMKTTRTVIILYKTDKNAKWGKNNQCTDTPPLQFYLYIDYLIQTIDFIF